MVRALAPSIRPTPVTDQPWPDQLSGTASVDCGDGTLDVAYPAFTVHLVPG